MVGTRVVVVTGASSAIGRAICEGLASDPSMLLFATYFRNEDAAMTLQERLGSDRCQIRQVDVREPTQVKELFDAVEAERAGLFGLVTVASYSDPVQWNADPLTLPLAAWNNALAIDLTGTYLCMRAAVPLLARSGGGSIVLFSSAGSLKGDPDTFCYNAAKVAVENLGKTFARLYAPAIRTNVVAPGSIDTGWVQDWRLTDEEVAQLEAVRFGMMRVGMPDEVARVVLFLMSNQASYINGQTLYLDGGASH